VSCSPKSPTIVQYPEFPGLDQFRSRFSGMTEIVEASELDRRGRSTTPILGRPDRLSLVPVRKLRQEYAVLSPDSKSLTNGVMPATRTNQRPFSYCCYCFSTIATQRPESFVAFGQACGPCVTHLFGSQAKGTRRSCQCISPSRHEQCGKTVID
jgi:hypothetical protein